MNFGEGFRVKEFFGCFGVEVVFLFRRFLTAVGE